MLQFVPGDGATVGGALVADPRIAGVCFTGSTDTARTINRTLAARARAIAAADRRNRRPERDDRRFRPRCPNRSSRTSASRRSTAPASAARPLRVLFVQEDIADKVIDMLAGAMDELVVGDPAPAVDRRRPGHRRRARKAMLDGHIARMEREGRLIRRVKLGPRTEHGTLRRAGAFEIDRARRACSAKCSARSCT